MNCVAISCRFNWPGDVAAKRLKPSTKATTADILRSVRAPPKGFRFSGYSKEVLWTHLTREL